MKDQEELLSQRMKDILSNTKNLQLTDFITNNQKDEVSIEEGALVTLLAEARRRNWAQDHTISYLKNETGLAMEIGRAQFGISYQLFMNIDWKLNDIPFTNRALVLGLVYLNIFSWFKK